MTQSIKAGPSGKVHIVLDSPGGYVVVTKCGKMLSLDGRSVANIPVGYLPKSNDPKCLRCYSQASNSI